MSVSFRKSSGFEELLPDMTNWIPLFWSSFTLPLLLSCCFRTRLHIFQSRPSLTFWFYAQIDLKKDRLGNHFGLLSLSFLLAYFTTGPDKKGPINNYNRDQASSWARLAASAALVVYASAPILSAKDWEMGPPPTITLK